MSFRDPLISVPSSSIGVKDASAGLASVLVPNADSHAPGASKIF